MKDRFWRVVAVGFLTIGTLFVAQPYVDRAIVLSAKPAVIEPRADLGTVEKNTVSLFARVSPSVVQISGRGMSDQSTGSGFAWDSSGHIVTNGHVVQDADQLSVHLPSGEVARAELVGVATDYDLAVLRVSRTLQPLPPISVGDSLDLRVGQAAYAIGSPFGLQQSLTTGVISALKRKLPTKDGHQISDVIQTDAAINPGSSGGPLVDSAGRVIGIATAIYSPSGSSAGVGFAIPADVINRIVPEIIRAGSIPPMAQAPDANQRVSRRLTSIR